MQTRENQPQPEDEALQAPPGLLSALKQLPHEPSFIPPTLDEAILRAARRHLSAPARPRLNRLRFLPWLAAAAAVLLVVVIPRFFNKPASVANRGTAVSRGDLNHDDRVDILDAFALARQLQSGKTPNPQLDVNGDGVVDERDVTVLAARAVKLEKGGRS